MAKSDDLSTIEENFCRCMDVLTRWDEGASLQRMLEEPGMDVRIRNSLITLFRRRASIDWLIDDIASGKIKRPLRNLLRWSVCQIVPLKGIAPPIVVSFSVEMARKRFGEAQARFVNAVLRRIADAEMGGAVEAWLAKAPEWVRLELGEELYRSWTSFMERDQLLELAEVLQGQAAVTARLCSGCRMPEAVEPYLDPVPENDFLDNLQFFCLRRPSRFFARRDEWHGRFYIQDPATGLAPLMMTAEPGQTIGDLCAAPGGKSIILSECMHGEGMLVAADRSWNRLPKLRENLEMADAPVHVVAADVARPCLRPQCFDGILLDVPCTNSGVVRRRPDVRWRYTRRKKASIVELQRDILEGVLPAVRPGGCIVYSTCSLEPEENNDQVQAFLDRHPECSLEAERQLLPVYWRDGAYAARIRVTGA